MNANLAKVLRYSQAGSKGRKNVKVVPFLPGHWMLRTQSLP